MSTSYVIGFKDRRPIGTADAVQMYIRKLCPDVKFGWTITGPEQIRLAKERGIKFPPILLNAMRSLPALLEGHANGPNWYIFFGLGHTDPLTELVIETRGDSTEIDLVISEIEREIGTKLRVHGDIPPD